MTPAQERAAFSGITFYIEPTEQGEDAWGRADAWAVYLMLPNALHLRFVQAALDAAKDPAMRAWVGTDEELRLITDAPLMTLYAWPLIERVLHSIDPDKDQAPAIWKAIEGSARSESAVIEHIKRTHSRSERTLQ
jgi:hypothetical protein